jgi:hypothetical protein
LTWRISRADWSPAGTPMKYVTAQMWSDGGSTADSDLMFPLAAPVWFIFSGPHWRN